MVQKYTATPRIWPSPPTTTTQRSSAASDQARLASATKRPSVLASRIQYAVAARPVAQRRLKAHDPDGEFLLEAS